MRELEVKREETRAQAKAQMAADQSSMGGAAGAASRAEAHLNRIATLEQRAHFAAEDELPARTNASVDREIEEMRRARAIDAEVEAMRAATEKKAARKAK